MIAEIQKGEKQWKFNLQHPLDISLSITASPQNPSAWYVNPPRIEPVRTEQFIGSVAEGGSVNFRNIYFNPHGHGTHTECVGHISKEVYSINQVLKQFFFLAELISIEPETTPAGDQLITSKQIESLRNNPLAEALIIRSYPNTEEKRQRQYSSTNPPYIEAEAMKNIIQSGIKHLLIDLPSVDREVDGGVLAAHHAFWEHPEKTNLERTITELIFVPDSIIDGTYLLNLQIASFENDAAPSKPILYPLV
jgi:kynurenine formamidase